MKQIKTKHDDNHMLNKIKGLVLLFANKINTVIERKQQKQKNISHNKSRCIKLGD